MLWWLPEHSPTAPPFCRPLMAVLFPCWAPCLFQRCSIEISTVPFCIYWWKKWYAVLHNYRQYSTVSTIFTLCSVEALFQPLLDAIIIGLESHWCTIYSLYNWPAPSTTLWFLELSNWRDLRCEYGMVAVFPLSFDDSIRVWSFLILTIIQQRGYLNLPSSGYVFRCCLVGRNLWLIWKLQVRYASSRVIRFFETVKYKKVHNHPAVLW